MIMISKDTIKQFWDYINQTCTRSSINNAILDNEFDRSELEDNNLEKLNQDELNNLMQYLVYIIVNGPGGGDYESMYDILAETMELDRETVSFLLET